MTRLASRIALQTDFFNNNIASNILCTDQQQVRKNNILFESMNLFYFQIRFLCLS